AWWHACRPRRAARARGAASRPPVGALAGSGPLATAPAAMKPSIAAKLDQLFHRLDELNGLLSSEGATRDLGEFKRLSREHAEIAPIVARYRDYKSAESDLAAATEMLADPATRSFAEGE